MIFILKVSVVQHKRSIKLQKLFYSFFILKKKKCRATQALD